MKVDAVILAGGKLKDTDTDKAFIKLGELTLLDRMVHTLRSCADISKIIVTSVPQNYQGKTVIDDLIYDSGDLIENIALAIEKVQSPNVLLVASDIPLTKSNHISDFLDSCEKVTGDIYYPLIPRSVLGRFGSMKRTFFKLDRIEFTGGNVMLINKELWTTNLEMARQVYNNRKSPLKTARLVGFFFLLKLLSGRLSVEEVEKKSSNILGGLVKGVIVRHPEIGSDIDKQEDLEFMETMLAGVSGEERRV